MASSPITSWEIDGETVETVSDFIFLGSKIYSWIWPVITATIGTLEALRQYSFLCGILMAEM